MNKTQKPSSTHKILRFNKEIFERVKMMCGEDVMFCADNTVRRKYNMYEEEPGEILGFLKEYKGKVVFITKYQDLTEDGVIKDKKMVQTSLFS